MHNFQNYLIMFKNLEISKNQLYKESSLVSSENINRCTIGAQNLIAVLIAFKDKKINQNQLLDWVNVVWFSDWFAYDNNECDAIAAVMDQLEELDERSYELTVEEIEYYVKALEYNIDISLV
jgi:hypothetical protein